jgi:hypothetical protein
MTADVPLKEHLEKLIAEQDKRAALALAALNKNRSETISYIWFAQLMKSLWGESYT